MAIIFAQKRLVFAKKQNNKKLPNCKICDIISYIAKEKEYEFMDNHFNTRLFGRNYT